MRTMDVTVTIAAQGEAGLLERHMAVGPVGKHRERLAAQMSGEPVYLVAARAGLPVGHVLLRWNGSPHEPMASDLRNCPHIEELFVLPDSCSEGIGSRLLAAAEKLARQRGYSRIGLGVALGNPVLALYKRRGFRDSGFGEYRHDVVDDRENGQGEVAKVTDIYLIKELGQGRASRLWRRLSDLGRPAPALVTAAGVGTQPGRCGS